MGVRILQDKDDNYQCMYCSVSMCVFGPIFYEDEDISEFCKWLEVDPRGLSSKALEDKVDEWRKTKEKEV